MSDQGYPPVIPKKLPVWQTAKAAYLVIFHNPGLSLRLALVPLMFVVISTVLQTYYWVGIPEEIFINRIQDNPLLYALVYVFGLVSHVATIPMITAWHRLVLLGHSDRNARIRYSIANTEWAYLWKTVLFVLVIGAIYFGVGIVTIFMAMVLSNIDANIVLAVFLILLGFLPILTLAAVVLRFSLVFPGAAIGQPMSFVESWRQSKGNTWRLFAAVAMGFIPFILIGSILGAGPIIAHFTGDASALPSMTVQISLALANVPFWLAGLCVGVSVWSWAYRYLVQNEPITLPGETGTITTA